MLILMLAEQAVYPLIYFLSPEFDFLEFPYDSQVKGSMSEEGLLQGRGIRIRGAFILKQNEEVEESSWELNKTE